MNKQNKLATMPVRPLLYTMAVPLMLSLLLLFELFLSLSHLPLRQSYAVTSPLDLEMVSSIWLDSPICTANSMSHSITKNSRYSLCLVCILDRRDYRLRI